MTGCKELINDVQLNHRAARNLYNVQFNHRPTKKLKIVKPWGCKKLLLSNTKPSNVRLLNPCTAKYLIITTLHVFDFFELPSKTFNVH